MTHDPSEKIRELQQLLVSDKKKIAFLFGAGTSLAKKNNNSIIVPSIGKMTSYIETELNKKSKHNTAINEIRLEIESKKLSYNVESLLSNIEQKIQIIGDGNLNNLGKDDFDSLMGEIKKQIREIVSIHKQILEKDVKLENLIHVDFAEWIGRVNRKNPIEIFTTNYDYLFELGLEKKTFLFMMDLREAICPSSIQNLLKI